MKNEDFMWEDELTFRWRMYEYDGMNIIFAYLGGEDEFGKMKIEENSHSIHLNGWFNKRMLMELSAFCGRQIEIYRQQMASKYSSIED